MRPSPETVRMVLSAQMAKAGPPMDGKDLHLGDFGCGILPASAPLAIGTLTLAGMALAFQREGSGRVAISFIGEGGASLGEWHEAINLCAARKLPAVFCLENNQTALSTPVREQSAVRVFADKAAGYGIPGITIDGTDPDEIAAAVRVGGRAGASGARAGADRAGGDAHVRTRPSRRHALSRPRHAAVVAVPATRRSGICRARGLRLLVGARSDRPVCRSACRRTASSATGELDRWKTRDRRAGRARGPDGDRRALARRGCLPAPAFRPASRRARAWRCSIRRGGSRIDPDPALPDVDPGPPFDRNGATFLEAVDARCPRCAARRPARVRLRRGRRRRVRQRVPAAAAAARGVRRSHHQFPAGRRCGAGRLRRRRARRAAADRRDAVQRLRRHRLQPAGEQRREDPLPVGRRRADGRAHAVGRSPARRVRITARTPNPGSTARRG